MHAHRVASGIWWEGKVERDCRPGTPIYIVAGLCLTVHLFLPVYHLSIYLIFLPSPPSLPPFLVTLIAADIVLAPPFIFLLLLPLPPRLLLPASPLPSSSFSALSFFFPYSLPLPSPPLSFPLPLHPSLSYRWAALKYIVLLTSQL